jgi:uncharacterized protein YeeX (DUF496 family)
LKERVAAEINTSQGYITRNAELSKQVEKLEGQIRELSKTIKINSR